MASSQTEICNLALFNIGVSEQIDAITDDVPEAAALNLVYDMVLENCLKRFDWPFARRKLTLSTVAGDPPEPWAYQYGWPSAATCVRVLRIDDGLSSRRPRHRIPFESYTDGSGVRLLLTNMSDAEAWVTHPETDPTKYPQSFIEFFSWALSAKIASPLTKDESIAKHAYEMAIAAYATAVADEQESEQEDPEPEASWIEFRDGGVGGIPGIAPFDFLP